MHPFPTDPTSAPAARTHGSARAVALAAVVATLAACAPEPCPAGFLRDNAGNCIQVDADTGDRAPEPPRWTSPAEGDADTDVDADTDADADAEPDTEPDTDPDNDAHCRDFFVGTWAATGWYVDDCGYLVDALIIWDFTAFNYETWYETSNGGRSGTWECEWDAGVLHLDNIDYEFVVEDDDTFHWYMDASLASCGILFRQ